MLAAAVILLAVNPDMLDFTNFPGLANRETLPGLVLLAAIWVTLAAGILFRLIPNKYVSVGAGKHFAVRYRPAGREVSPETDRPACDEPACDELVRTELVRTELLRAKKQLHNGAAKVAVFWVLLNIAFFVGLFAAGWLIPGAAIVLALAYSVTDRLFVRFFCPFRAFFMKNECCTVCRIYNWDYIMICTPLLLFPSWFALTLAALALALLLRWEWVLKKRPYFFY